MPAIVDMSRFFLPITGFSLPPRGGPDPGVVSGRIERQRLRAQTT
jgi:hypothetical protein